MDVSTLLEVFELYLDKYRSPRLSRDPLFLKNSDIRRELNDLRTLRASMECPFNAKNIPLLILNDHAITEILPDFELVGSRPDIPILISSDEEDAATSSLRFRLLPRESPVRRRPINLLFNEEADTPTENEGSFSEEVTRVSPNVIQLKLYPKRKDKRKRKREGTDSPHVSMAPQHSASSGFHKDGFQGLIDKTSAAALALSMESLQPQWRQVFFVDGSVVSNRGAAGVVWKDATENKWIGEGFPVPFSPISSLATELFAIRKALELATERAQFSLQSSQGLVAERQQVLVFSDCVECLVRIQACKLDSASGGPAKKRKLDRYQKFQSIIDPIIASSRVLSCLGVSIELHFVPGHSGVPGNLSAHNMARRGARLIISRQTLAKNITSRARRLTSRRRETHARHPEEPPTCPPADTLLTPAAL